MVRGLSSKKFPIVTSPHTCTVLWYEHQAWLPAVCYHRQTTLCWWGLCWLKSKHWSFVLIEKKTDEQYGGYNLLQNVEFNVNFSTKVWRKCDKLNAKGTHTPTHGLKKMCMKKRLLLRSTSTPLTEGGVPVQLKRQSFLPANRITFPSFPDHQSISRSIFICPFTY